MAASSLWIVQDKAIGGYLSYFAQEGWHFTNVPHEAMHFVSQARAIAAATTAGFDATMVDVVRTPLATEMVRDYIR